jgi:hypothetical protein
MVDLYPSENLNAWNLLSVRHFVYNLLFHVHLPRFEDILIWINRSKVFHIWHSDPYMDRLRPSRAQGLPKYIYLSPLLIFPTTYNGIRTKNRPVWITPGAAPIRWMGPIRNPSWEQKQTEGYVIISTLNVA